MSAGQGSISFETPLSTIATLLTNADNGLSFSTITPNTVVLGQDAQILPGVAQLLSSRFIPFNGFNITLFGDNTNGSTNEFRIQGTNASNNSLRRYNFNGTSIFDEFQLETLVASNTSRYNLRVTLADISDLAGNLAVYNFTAVRQGGAIANRHLFDWFDNTSNPLLRITAGREVIVNDTAATLDNNATLQVNGTMTGQRLVQAHTANYSPGIQVNCRILHTNEGAAGAITASLPAAVAGLEYTFYVQTAQNHIIDAAAGDTVRVGASVSAASGNATSNTVGSALHLVCINATEWIATSVLGTWTVT